MSTIWGHVTATTRLYMSEITTSGLLFSTTRDHTEPREYHRQYVGNTLEYQPNCHLDCKMHIYLTRGWLYKKDNNRFPILTQLSWKNLTHCHLQTSSGTLKILFFSGQFQLVCLSEPTYLIILCLAVLLNCSHGFFWIALWPQPWFCRRHPNHCHQWTGQLSCVPLGLWKTKTCAGCQSTLRQHSEQCCRNRVLHNAHKQ